VCSALSTVAPCYKKACSASTVISENNKRKLHTMEDWNERMIGTKKLAHNILEFVKTTGHSSVA